MIRFDPDDGFPRAVPHGVLATLVGTLILTAAYFAFGELGYSLTEEGESASLLWPSAGIAFGVVYRFGYRYLLGVFLGVVASKLYNEVPSVGTLGVACSTTFSCLIGVILLRQSGFHSTFNTQRDVFRFLALAAAVVPGITAISATFSLCFVEVIPWFRFSPICWTWWLGDALGILLFAPPIISFVSIRHLRVQSRSGLIETLVAIGGIGILSAIFLGPYWSNTQEQYPFRFVPTFCLALIGVRCRLWTTSVCWLVLATATAWATAYNHGPFGSNDSAQGTIVLWVYLTVVSIVILLSTVVLAERDRAVEGLRVSEAQYRTLVEDNPAMICRLDRSGEVLFANESFAQALRIPMKELLGKPFLLGLSPEDRANLNETLNSLQDGVKHACLTFPAPGGRLRWYKWTLRAIVNSDQSIVGYHAVGLDITEVHRAEQTRRAVEEQMYHTQKLESLGVMAGGIAHDFNNILTGILGHAELAAEEVDRTDSVYNHLTCVVESARRAADLTRHLLAYAGKGKLDICEIDLNQVIRETIRLTALSVPKQCMVKWEPTPSLSLIQGDSGQLSQVLMNLIINAGEAIGNQAGTVLIQTDVIEFDPIQIADSIERSKIIEGMYVRLCVSDTGAGMDEATAAKVFDPFFTTKFTGRGLGLAAVQGIIRSHHGTIFLTSEAGKGTTFTVLLPARSAPHHAGQVTPTSFKQTATIRQAQARTQSSDRVLIIDDEELILQIASSYLSQIGWDVVTASDGQKGIELFQSDPTAFDLVIVDWSMPETNGEEVLRQIRRLRKNVPVLISTGFDPGEIPETWLKGPTAILNKPYRGEELLQAVLSVAAHIEESPRVH